MKTTSLSILSYLLHAEFSFVARVSNIRRMDIYLNRVLFIVTTPITSEDHRFVKPWPGFVVISV